MSKTIVIYHSADFDGIFCREIARKFLPDAELIGWDFGDKPIAYERLHGRDVYVMDLPCDAPVGAKFPDDGAKTLDMRGRYYGTNSLAWIDHHKSAIESHPKDAITIPGYRIDGVAACRLAWQWFTHEYASHVPGNQIGYPLPSKKEFVERTVSEPLSVRLAGEYDIWDKRDPDAELFQHGLRSQALNDNMWDLMLVEAGEHEDGVVDAGTITVRALLDNGRVLQYAQTQQNESIIKAMGFTIQFEGLTFLACNHARYNSHLFTAGIKPEHDALFGFKWDGQQWSVSLYHAPGKEHHDLSLIAVKHGGGGHKGACGFRTKSLPFLT